VAVVLTRGSRLGAKALWPVRHVKTHTRAFIHKRAGAT
jgi:hypothetical protein